MAQPVVHFEIIGTDPARLRDYYGELFDWQFSTGGSVAESVSEAGNYGFAELPGIPGGVGGGVGFATKTVFYVGVPDVEAALRDAERLGGTRTMGPERAPGRDLAHCESIDSSILDTTVESFDRHFAVNTRGSWLLIAEFARRYRGERGAGRIIAITSDHTVHNLPYGASKGALDRIVLAAARELQDLRITANVINPGPIDTGWMDDQVREWALARSPRGRAGRPSDTAAVVSFLCSPKGDWINGQLLYSDGGIKT